MDRENHDVLSTRGFTFPLRKSDLARTLATSKQWSLTQLVSQQAFTEASKQPTTAGVCGPGRRAGLRAESCVTHSAATAFGCRHEELL